jgi:hypothetical protein
MDYPKLTYSKYRALKKAGYTDDIISQKTGQSIPNPFQKQESLNQQAALASQEYESSKKFPVADTLASGGGLLGAYYAGRKIAREVPKQTGSLMRGIANVSTKDVKTLKEIGPKNVFQPRYESESFIADTLVPETKKSFQDIVARKSKDYASAIDKVDRTSYMDLGNTKQALTDIFDELGPAAKSGKTFSDTGLKKLADMLDTISTEGAMPRATVDILRDNVSDIFKTIPDRNNILANKVKSALYKDYEVAGATGLTEASKNYSDVFGINKYTDETKLNSILSRGATKKSGSLTARALKEIVPEKADEIMGELTKHRIAQEFNPSGRLSVTKSGIAGRVSKPILKTYYKDIYPILEKIRSNKFLRSVKKGIGKSLPVVGTAGMLYDGMSYLDDPQQAVARQLGLELAPKGSIERQFQLEQIT